MILIHPHKQFYPSPPILQTFFVTEPKAVITVTIVEILKIPYSAASAVNFKL